YPSSEYFKLTGKLLTTLNGLSKHIMTCPDLDSTGQMQNHELCTNPTDDRYLNIRTIALPEALKEHKDQYGRPCKDLRDFLNYFTYKNFSGLVKTSKAYRFWDTHESVDPKSEKVRIKFGQPVLEYRLSNERIIFFIQQFGFCKHKIA